MASLLSVRTKPAVLFSRVAVPSLSVPVIMETERDTGLRETPGCLRPRWVALSHGESSRANVTCSASSLEELLSRLAKFWPQYGACFVLFFSNFGAPAGGSSSLSTCPTLESSMKEGSLAWPHTPQSTESLLVKNTLPLPNYSFSF